MPSSFFNTNDRGDRVAPPVVLPPVESTPPAVENLTDEINATPDSPLPEAPLPETTPTGAPTLAELATPSATVPPVADPTPTSQATPPPVPPITDDRIIRGFFAAQPAACEKLRRDLQLDLTPTHLAQLQQFFNQTLRREPTVGEVRLLCALHLTQRGQPHRVAVSHLSTNSPDLSQTWSYMMDTHTALCRGLGTHEATVPPCTLEDALLLNSRYLRRRKSRLGIERASARAATLVLTTPTQAAMAVATGYKWVGSAPALTADSPAPRIYRWPTTGRKTTPTSGKPARPGDLLIAACQVPLATMEAFLDTTVARKYLSDIRAITHSPLHTVLDLCPSADLVANRFALLFGQATPAPPYPSHLPVEALCQPPTTMYGQGNFIFRAPAMKATELCRSLEQAGVTTVVLGLVRTGNHTLIRMQTPGNTTPVLVADLPSQILRDPPSIQLCAFDVDKDLPVAAPAPLVGDPIHLPLSTSDMTEAVVLATVVQPIPPEADGYYTARDAVTAAVGTLTETGIPQTAITLSVSLLCHEMNAATGLPSPGSRTLETICGLYRAAADREMILADPALTVEAAPPEEPSPQAPAALTLTVTAWAHGSTPTKTSRSFLSRR